MVNLPAPVARDHEGPGEANWLATTRANTVCEALPALFVAAHVYEVPAFNAADDVKVKVLADASASNVTPAGSGEGDVIEYVGVGDPEETSANCTTLCVPCSKLTGGRFRLAKVGTASTVAATEISVKGAVEDERSTAVSPAPTEYADARTVTPKESAASKSLVDLSKASVSLAVVLLCRDTPFVAFMVVPVGAPSSRKSSAPSWACATYPLPVCEDIETSTSAPPRFSSVRDAGLCAEIVVTAKGCSGADAALGVVCGRYCEDAVQTTVAVYEAIGSSKGESLAATSSLADTVTTDPVEGVKVAVQVSTGAGVPVGRAGRFTRNFLSSGVNVGAAGTAGAGRKGVALAVGLHMEGIYHEDSASE